MEVTLKDESGVTPSSILEKTIALTNEVQVKTEPPAVDVLKDVNLELPTVPEGKILNNDDSVPVQEKIANAVNSAVEAVVDGVKGLVDAVKTKTEGDKVNIENSKSDQVQTADSLKEVGSEPLAPPIQIIPPTPQPSDGVTTPIEIKTAVSESAVETVSAESKKELEAVGGQNPIDASPVVPAEQASTPEVPQSNEKEVKTSESVDVQQKTEPIEKVEAVSASDLPVQNKVDNPVEQKTETTADVAGDVKVEQLSSTVDLVQDKLIVEQLQETPAATDKPEGEVPTDATPSETKTDTPVTVAVEEAAVKVASPVIEAVKEAVEEVAAEATAVPEVAKTEEVPPPLPASPPPEEKPATPAPAVEAPHIPTLDSVVGQAGDAIAKVDETVKEVKEQVQEQVAVAEEKVAEVSEQINTTVEEVTNKAEEVIAEAPSAADVAAVVEDVVSKTVEEITDKEEEQGAGESLADVPKDLVEEVAAMTVDSSDSVAESSMAEADGGGNDE